MIGFYVLEKKEGKIQLTQMLKEPAFVPMNEISEVKNHSLSFYKKKILGICFRVSE